MRVSEILKAKRGNVVIVRPDDVVKTASSRIAQVGKELAVVCDENESPIGIISVIDINRAVVMYGDRAPGMTVRDVMSTDMVVCGRSDSVEHALDVMMKWGIRHLPVVAEGRLEGIVNIQDLLEARFDEAQLGLDEMRPYVFGVGLHQTARHDTN